MCRGLFSKTPAYEIDLNFKRVAFDRLPVVGKYISILHKNQPLWFLLVWAGGDGLETNEGEAWPVRQKEMCCLGCWAMQMRVFVLTSGMRCDRVKQQSSFCLPCFVCITTLPKEKEKERESSLWVLFNSFSLYAWKVSLFPACLISRGLQLGPALISCNYKRIPVVTQSYSRLKELAVQRNAGTASESHRTQFAHVWSVYLTKKKIHFNSVWLIWLAIATRIKSFFQHFSPWWKKNEPSNSGKLPPL